MWHEWETGQVYTGFCSGDLRGRFHWEDLVLDGRIILNVLSINGLWAWTGLLVFSIWGKRRKLVSAVMNILVA